MKEPRAKAREGDSVRLLADVCGYLSKGDIPRGAHGYVVEAYTKPHEGYAVDFMTREPWDPEGPEWDNVILLPEQFEVIPHPCTVHIDADLPTAPDLAEQLGSLINGRAAGNHAFNDECSFEVFLDPPDPLSADLEPDFIDFRFRLSGEARLGVSEDRMAAIVASILQYYWSRGVGAVALCDYRHLLPRNGGVPDADG